jgi:hypothetical protein
MQFELLYANKYDIQDNWGVSVTPDDNITGWEEDHKHVILSLL